MADGEQQELRGDEEVQGSASPSETSSCERTRWYRFQCKRRLQASRPATITVAAPTWSTAVV